VLSGTFQREIGWSDMQLEDNHLLAQTVFITHNPARPDCLCKGDIT
jgi:hypothetical protein